MLSILVQRLREKNRYIQVLSGPRQVGKTTLARQALEEMDCPYQYASADDPGTKGNGWIEQQWQAARLQQGGVSQPFLLVLDEIQKISQWSEQVKQLWDEDRLQDRALKVLLLGSAPLLMQKGLTESLAGRFETLPVMHWTFPEMKEAFGWNLNQYCYFGAYPGAAPFIADEPRWKRYVLDGLIEPTLSKDVLLMQRIDKPALLRQLFHLSCDYSGQILSYQKMLGQLDDAGNTTTLAHYLKLLDAAGMVTGLSKASNQKYKQRASSPKLQVYNMALMTAQSPLSFEACKSDTTRWGRLVESMVGAFLQNAIQGTDIQLFYWREGDREVDFLLQQGEKWIAIEVKSGLRKGLSGIDAFKQIFPQAKLLLVGGTGVPLEAFVSLSIQEIMAL